MSTQVCDHQSSCTSYLLLPYVARTCLTSGQRHDRGARFVAGGGAILEPVEVVRVGIIIIVVVAATDKSIVLLSFFLLSSLVFNGIGILRIKLRIR